MEKGKNLMEDFWNEEFSYFLRRSNAVTTLNDLENTLPIFIPKKKTHCYQAAFFSPITLEEPCCIVLKGKICPR